MALVPYFLCVFFVGNVSNVGDNSLRSLFWPPEGVEKFEAFENKKEKRQVVNLAFFDNANLFSTSSQINISAKFFIISDYFRFFRIFLPSENTQKYTLVWETLLISRRLWQQSPIWFKYWVIFHSFQNFRVILRQIF